ncbi:uncharacterized protein LOC131218476 [Magnolia sinica]|uniref:uncharacterized protein LOC131218476 n=1 Tax=Magnolia sinica TaxID=86752 RepID=UPI00265A3F8B|nr:uncharacterized protein LOC131218476 [Magnolia sinica]
MALSSFQFYPRFGPKLPALTRPRNSKYYCPSPNLEHSHTPRLRVSAIPPCFLHPNYTNVSARSSGPFLPPHGVAPSHQIDPFDDGPQAIDTVHDLYSAIGSRNTGEITHLISDDCKCTCNFTPLRGLYEGKKHVIGFLTGLIGSMGESMVMKVDTSCYGEGDTVGVLWHMEWMGIRVPFGKGCTFHTCESRDGKILIRDMEIFMESLVKLGFLQLRLMGLMMFIFGKCMRVAMGYLEMGTTI